MKPYQTLLFYKYVRIEEAEIFAIRHLKFCKRINIKGRILMADEGLNGTVGGTVEQCQQYMDHLKSDPRFSDMAFKIDEEDRPSFVKIYVRYKKEIVYFGQSDVSVWEHSGKYVEPEEWVKMKDEEDTVILDVRNKVEWEIGRFKNAVTLDMDYFRELPEHLTELEKYRDKKILAYCTGGIRCEKATAFLREHGFKNVFHLHGGIIEYGKKAGGKDFDGQCYVFDNRISVPVNEVNPSVISVCKHCGTQSIRMVNCANPDCNLHFVICELCGEKFRGCCSDECMKHPSVRPYDGSGFYQKESAT